MTVQEPAESTMASTKTSNGGTITPGKVITITSGKGGVGKTTATANLGTALVSLGRRVVCVDTDIGLRNLDLILGLEDHIVYNLVDVVEKRATVSQALIRHKAASELYLLPSSQSRDKSAVDELQMMILCNELKKSFDYVLIDSPAGIEHGFRLSLAPADQVIIITTPEVSALRDADRVVGILGSKKQVPHSLVINRYRPNMVKRGRMLGPDEVIEILSGQLIGIIPEDEEVINAAYEGKPVTFNSHSPAGREFVKTARRLLGEEIPFQAMSDSLSLIDRLLGR
jgi:septum site-determining protein MinD